MKADISNEMSAFFIGKKDNKEINTIRIMQLSTHLRWYICLYVTVYTDCIDMMKLYRVKTHLKKEVNYGNTCHSRI